MLVNFMSNLIQNKLPTQIYIFVQLSLTLELTHQHFTNK